VRRATLGLNVNVSAKTGGIQHACAAAIHIAAGACRDRLGITMSKKNRGAQRRCDPHDPFAIGEGHVGGKYRTARGLGIGDVRTSSGSTAIGADVGRCRRVGLIRERKNKNDDKREETHGRLSKNQFRGCEARLTRMGWAVLVCQGRQGFPAGAAEEGQAREPSRSKTLLLPVYVARSSKLFEKHGGEGASWGRHRHPGSPTS